MNNCARFGTVEAVEAIPSRQVDDFVIALSQQASDVDLTQEIRARRKRQVRIVVLKAFGDESYDDGKKRVFAVAGLMGTQEEWDELEGIWIDRTGGKIFHATDCESDQGDYKGIPHSENQKLYRDLTKILVEKTKMMGYGASIDLEEHRRIFPGLPDDLAYCTCFNEVVKYLAHLAGLHIPKVGVGFMFEFNEEAEFGAEALYKSIRSSKEWGPLLADTISFGDKSQVGLQAADLIAREAMKDLDNTVGPVKRKQRQSFTALIRSNRFSFQSYGRDQFLHLKGKVQDLDANRQTHQLSFAEWLLDKKTVDSLVNRINYRTYLRVTTKSK